MNYFHPQNNLSGPSDHKTKSNQSSFLYNLQPKRMKNFKLTSSFRSWKMVTMSILSCLFTMVAIQSSVAQTNNYFGTSGTLSGSVWSTNPAGPYTSALNTTGGAIINFQNVASFTGASITVAGINASANASIGSNGGTISNHADGIVAIDVAPGVTLDFGTQAWTTSTTAGYIKNGDGVLALSGGAYGGGFTLNSGTVVLRGINAMGFKPTNSLIVNGGTISADGNQNLTGKYPNGIVIGGNFTIGATTGLASSSANITFSNNMALGNGTSRTVIIGGTGTYTFGGVVSGTGSNLTVDATAAGTLALTNTNTYSGTTTINGGTLDLNRTGGNTLPSSSNVVVNGGTLRVLTNQTLNNLTVGSGGTVYVASGVNLIINGTYAVSSTSNVNGGNVIINGILKIEQGGYPGNTGNWTFGIGGTLEFANTSGPYGINNEVWWPSAEATRPTNVHVSGTGGIQMNVSRTVSGNFEIHSQVAGTAVTLDGFVEINPGGYFSTAPNYGSASTLSYNTGGTYSRGMEWSSTFNPGYPHHVLITNNTSLDLGNAGTGVLRRCGGDLTINPSSALYMDFGANDMTQPLEINGNLDLFGTLSLSDVLGGDLKIRGDFNHYGTINTKDRAVFFDGTADQTIGGQLLELDFVVVDKASGDLILGDNLLCNKTLTLTNGKINTDGYQVEVICTGDISRTNGWVNGNLKVCIPTGATARTLAVGDANVYGGVDVSFGNVTASGDLTPTTAVTGGPPAIGAVPGGSGLSQTKYVNRKWTVTNTGVVFNNYNATFHFSAGDIAGGADPNNFIVGKKDGGSWSAPTVGTKTATSTQITGATSFSEFSVAEACVPPSIASISAAANPICGDATTTLSANSVMGDGATVTWWTATGGTGTPVGSGLTSNPVGPGTYYAYVTGHCGTAEISFMVNAKTNVDITGITPTANPICAEQTTTLTANGVIGDGAVVTWYTGPNGTGSNLGTGLSLPGAATGTTYCPCDRRLWCA
ncbi:MAG: hypothetical protein IPJ51_24280 [Saprospiraceae bacterium]|nr:hypothetical protein [Saprospiraceae bacterium]